MKSAFIIPSKENFHDYVAFARQEAIDGVELMFHAPKDASVYDDADSVLKFLKDNGVKAAAVGLWHLGVADPPGAGSRDAIARAMDYAAAVEATCFFTGAGEPEADDKPAALADSYAEWATRAAERGMDFALYLGHKGSFINSEELLAQVCERIPDVGLKLDPVGIIRNLRADPLKALYRFGRNLTYFHVKGITKFEDGEIEPPPGLDSLPWKEMFGVLHQYGYDGWVSAEPHGAAWGKTPELRKKYVRLTFAQLRPMML